MTIDHDVAMESSFFGVDATLIQAVVNAEGDIVKAVQCSIPTVTTRAKALEVLCRSCVHAMSDYIKTCCGTDSFVVFWGNRWAPKGVANDPHGLNANWVSNVEKLWATARKA